MQIQINNRETETEAKNLFELASEMSLPSAGVAMAIDNKMVPRAEWEQTELTQGTNIIIIKAACGG